MNTNFDDKKVNELILVISQKLGISPDQLKKELNEGKFNKALASMNNADAQKFNQILNDPKSIEKIMSTPQAKALYKKLSGDK